MHVPHPRVCLLLFSVLLGLLQKVLAHQEWHTRLRASCVCDGGKHVLVSAQSCLLPHRRRRCGAHRHIWKLSCHSLPDCQICPPPSLGCRGRRSSSSSQARGQQEGTRPPGAAAQLLRRRRRQQRCRRTKFRRLRSRWCSAWLRAASSSQALRVRRCSACAHVVWRMT